MISFIKHFIDVPLFCTRTWRKTRREFAADAEFVDSQLKSIRSVPIAITGLFVLRDKVALLV